MSDDPPAGDDTQDTDAELIAEYLRLVQVVDGWQLQVGVPEWESQTPVLRWKRARHWQRPPSPERLAAAQQRALATPRFFRTCVECGERQNAGHMEGDTCHACMSRVWGVVF